MRIVAGSARSRTIEAPRGMDTRPTLDRVRETIFDILQFSVPGARVLDLYAGSGAMALEALSRGAAEAVLVDRDREALRVIKRNIASLGFEDRCTVLPCDDRAALQRLGAKKKAFDIVFLDPPYRMETDPAIQEILERGLLQKGGILCVEYDRLEPAAQGGLTLWKERKIGQTRLKLFRLEEM